MYHVGVGNIRAEFPVSLAKYMQKLMMVLGQIIEIGATTVMKKYTILLHFSVSQIEF